MESSKGCHIIVFWYAMAFEFSPNLGFLSPLADTLESTQKRVKIDVISPPRDYARVAPPLREEPRCHQRGLHVYSIEEGEGERDGDG